MDHSGRGHLPVYGLSSLGTRALEGDASVWTLNDTDLKARRSPLAASFGFHEAEDSEDYMAGLAEEIAQSMLLEDEGSCWKRSQVLLSTSPQSTLVGLSSWDLLSSSAGSSGDMPSGVSSPPTPMAGCHSWKDENDALDLLYAELLRLKMEDEIKLRQQQLIRLKQQQHYQELLWKIQQRSQSLHLRNSETIEGSRKTNNSAAHFGNATSPHIHKASGSTWRYSRSKLARSDQDVHPNYQSHRRQMNANAAPALKHTSSRCWPVAVDNGTSSRQTQQYGSTLNGSQHMSNKALQSFGGAGMRAVFLGSPGARESGGTGVFLPRRMGSAGSGHESSKRKPACSTVLLPSRIVQALNLNVEDTLVCSLNTPPVVPLQRGFVSHAPERVAARDRISGAEMAKEVGVEGCGVFSSTLQEVAPDVCLPTEWTY